MERPFSPLAFIKDYRGLPLKVQKWIDKQIGDFLDLRKVRYLGTHDILRQEG